MPAVLALDRVARTAFAAPDDRLYRPQRYRQFDQCMQMFQRACNCEDGVAFLAKPLDKRVGYFAPPASLDRFRLPRTILVIGAKPRVLFLGRWVFVIARGVDA